MEITYCSTYRDLCRTTLYGLIHRRDILLRIALPIVYMTFAIGNHFRHMNWLRFPIAAALALLVMIVILALTMQMLILWRVLTPANHRRCTTSLAPEGLADVTLRKAKQIPWSAISEIRYHQGDIFFWQKGKDGNFVPRSAFENQPQSQLFYESALHFWKAGKEGQFTKLSYDATVWPPPPRLEI